MALVSLLEVASYINYRRYINVTRSDLRTEFDENV